MYKQHSKALFAEEREINILHLFRALWSKLWIILLVALAAALIVYLCSALFITPTYRAGFTAYINNRLNTEDSSSTSTSDLTASMGLAYVYNEIITSRSVLTDAAEKCGLKAGFGALSEMVTTQISEGAPVVTVYVTAEDPTLAQVFAQAISETAPKHVSRVIEGSSMNVIDSPQLPTGRFAPNNKSNALMGFMIGLVLAALVVITMDLISGKVQDGQELEERYGVAVIGSIPDILHVNKNSYYYYSDKRKE